MALQCSTFHQIVVIRICFCKDAIRINSHFPKHSPVNMQSKLEIGSIQFYLNYLRSLLKTKSYVFSFCMNTEIYKNLRRILSIINFHMLNCTCMYKKFIKYTVPQCDTYITLLL